MDKLILVANPGSSSRKYALYTQQEKIVDLHFEQHKGRILCTIEQRSGTNQAHINVHSITEVSDHILDILEFYNIQVKASDIAKVGVRVVAPSSYFQVHRVLDGRAVEMLKDQMSSSKLHITATLGEITRLNKIFKNVPLIGISDSAYHSTIPEYINSYAIPASTAHKLDIKRFGYHGISVGSVVNQLRVHKKLSERVVVCHLGSGASVTAVKRGKSLDTTMGFSPLEGLMMATRSGSIDPVAVFALQHKLDFTTQQITEYLNNQSGLLGVSQVSADLREVLDARRNGDDQAKVAVNMYVHRIQQAVAAMSASLGGIDSLVFTGTVGERSSEIRSLVVAKLMYLGLHLSPRHNHQTKAATGPTRISGSNPVKIYVVPSKEDSEMARLAAIIR